MAKSRLPLETGKNNNTVHEKVYYRLVVYYGLGMRDLRQCVNSDEAFDKSLW